MTDVTRAVSLKKTMSVLQRVQNIALHTCLVMQGFSDAYIKDQKEAASVFHQEVVNAFKQASEPYMALYLPLTGVRRLREILLYTLVILETRREQTSSAAKGKCRLLLQGRPC